jgi:hypothetical protein
MPLNKEEKKLKKVFEREYEGKGMTKSKADEIFYKYERKHGFLKKK